MKELVFTICITYCFKLLLIHPGMPIHDDSRAVHQNIAIEVLIYEKCYYRTYVKSYGQRSARITISTATPLLPTALHLTCLYQNDDSEYPVRRSTERSKSMSYGARLFCCDSKSRMVSQAGLTPVGFRAIFWYSPCFLAAHK